VAGATGLHSFSLRNRLILAATLVLIIALGVVGFALNAANHRGAVSSLQARMESYVYLVLAAMEVNENGRLAMDADFTDPRLNQPSSGIYVQVQGREDRWTSPSSLGLQWPEQAVVEPGYTVSTEPGRGIGFFSLIYGVGWQLADDSIEPFTVLVLVDESEITQQTSAFRLGLWRALGAAGLILLLAQILIFFFGFRPLSQVTRDVARVESGLAEKLEGHYPRELEPLARNVNRLLETEKSNQARIRNALDSLAHSLKTPLAVIQAALPLHGGKSEASMQNAVDEIGRLIATRLERAGATARRTLAEPVGVEPQLQRVLDSLQKVYSHKLIQTACTLEEGLAFYGEKRDLLELLGNLLDNAFKYGARQVMVSGGVLEPGASRPGLWLRVEDDGPGIRESQWVQLLQRGSRGDEQVEGHGLGLAIVMELVTAYGGKVGIDHSELGGAMVFVDIPAS
jgi:two-component system sensor histidine kinase PhoQ